MATQMIDLQASENADFWQCLSRWLRVIQSMIRQGRAPLGMTDEDYVRLHRDLLSHVNAPTTNEPTPINPLRQTLHRSVRPWVHLESLVHCDKRILRMLEREVRVVRNQLMPRQHLRSNVRRRVVAVLFVLVIAAMIIAVGSSAERRAVAENRIGEYWQHLQGIRAQLWFGITQSSTNQRLTALAGSIILVGMYFLRNTRRS